MMLLISTLHIHEAQNKYDSRTNTKIPTKLSYVCFACCSVLSIWVFFLFFFLNATTTETVWMIRVESKVMNQTYFNIFIYKLTLQWVRMNAEYMVKFQYCLLTHLYLKLHEYSWLAKKNYSLLISVTYHHVYINELKRCCIYMYRLTKLTEQQLLENFL